MTRMTYSIDINRPVEDVFSALTDEDRLKEWVDGLVSIERLSEGDDPVGSISKHIYHENGRDIEMIEETVIFDPNKQVKIKGQTDMFDMTAAYKLSTIPNGTRVDFESTVKFHGLFMRLMSSLIAIMMRKKTNTDMHKLKALLEQGSGQIQQAG